MVLKIRLNRPVQPVEPETKGKSGPKKAKNWEPEVDPVLPQSGF